MPVDVREQLVDRFTIPIENAVWKVVESKNESKVDGKTILARVQGQFFLVNGESLNGRWYSESLWENCISNCQERFKNGGLFGTIGHDQPLDEDALRNGDISHTVTNLWIEDGKGMGEILVLGTESGKQLEVCLRAGLPIPVSSRAYGKVSGKGPNGSDLIDEKSFILETFDFVLSPGVPSAFPKVVENAKNHQQESLSMEKDVLEKLCEDKSQLQAQLAEVLTENKALVEKATKAEKTFEDLQKGI